MLFFLIGYIFFDLFHSNPISPAYSPFLHPPCSCFYFARDRIELQSFPVSQFVWSRNRNKIYTVYLENYMVRFTKIIWVVLLKLYGSCY